MVIELFRRRPKDQLEEIERGFAELIALTSEQVRSAIEVVIGHQQAIDVDYLFQSRRDVI